LLGGRTPLWGGVMGAMGPLEVHNLKVTPSPQPLSREERGLLVKRPMDQAATKQHTKKHDSAASSVAPNKNI